MAESSRSEANRGGEQYLAVGGERRARHPKRTRHAAGSRPDGADGGNVLSAWRKSAHRIRGVGRYGEMVHNPAGWAPRRLASDSAAGHQSYCRTKHAIGEDAG